MSTSASSPEVWLVRHGETDWSRSGRHTGHTDVALTERGEQQAVALGGWAVTINPDLVLCSPRSRARRTAELARLVPYQVDDDLQEWDYGDFEGLTSADIQADIPGWNIWQGPWRGGETGTDVAERADRLIGRLRESGARRIVLVGHGHFSRVTGVRWAGAEVAAGRWLEMDTASWSYLSWDRSVPVLKHWNVPVGDQRK